MLPRIAYARLMAQCFIGKFRLANFG